MHVITTNCLQYGINASITPSPVLNVLCGKLSVGSILNPDIQSNCRNLHGFVYDDAETIDVINVEMKTKKR